MTTDMGAAEAFYQPVVGWTTAPFDGAGQPYSIWNRPDGAPMGGVMTLPDELKAHRVPPHWMMYVGVNKLEDAVAHAKRLGGSTVSEVIEVPNVGRMQVLKDPQGAAFYVYEPGPQPQPPDGTVVDRALHDRQRRRDEVLRRALWLEADRVHGHGTDGRVPDVRAVRYVDRRDDEQDAGHGAHPAGCRTSAYPTFTLLRSASKRTAAA